MRTARRKDERGAVAILVAVTATILFIAAAMVVDLGLARDTQQQSQIAADASALAAGNVLYADDSTIPNFPAAVAAAKAYALNNFNVDDAEWAACTDPGRLAYTPPAETQCISFDSSTSPSQVRVLIPTREIETGLGIVAGVSRIPVAAAARSALNPPRQISCSVCVIGPGIHYIGNGDVSATGGTLSVDGAGIHVNGTLSGHQNAHVESSGEITTENPSPGPSYDPAANTAPQITDPLAGLTSLAPSFAGLTSKANPCGGSGGSGVYASYEVGNNTTCDLSPGLYVFTGTLSLKNTSRLRGSGVTLFFACKTGSTPRACVSPGEAGGIFDAKNGEVDIQAATGVFGATQANRSIAGIVVAYDRLNASVVTLQGNGNSELTGTVYAPASQVDANGNACHRIRQGAIVARDIYLNGTNSCLRVEDGRALTHAFPPSELHLDQ